MADEDVVEIDVSIVRQSILENTQNDEKLAETICRLSSTCCEIYRVLDRTLVSAVGSANLFGDEQLTADVVAEQAMWKAVKAPGSNVSTAASEEEPVLKKTDQDGPYCCLWDPLDGSSIITANWAVGTIIGLFDFGPVNTGSDIIGKPARPHIKASLIAVHGPRLVLVVSVGTSCLEFTEIDGKLVQSNGRVSVTSSDKKYFSPANLRATASHPGYKSLVNYYMEHQYTLRYSGGLVPDVYHIFVKGQGVFINPTTEGAPAKLRMLYEGIPLAHLMECAGGKATDGANRNILDVEIEGMDHRTAFVGGTPAEVDRAESFLNNWTNTQ